jgi:uncharacterized protein YukE
VTKAYKLANVKDKVKCMGGVEWEDKTRTDLCFPQYNQLKGYIERSRVFGIQEAYSDASAEVSRIYNEQNNKINELSKEVRMLTNALNKANVTLDELQNKKRPPAKETDGRKEKYMDDWQVERAKRMREDNISYAEIGKDLRVSSRTVRRAVKGEGAYKN